VLRRALSQQPEVRFDTVNEFVIELETIGGKLSPEDETETPNFQVQSPPAGLYSRYHPSIVCIGDTWTSPKEGMVMVFIPAGKFLMGSTDNNPMADDDEKPIHEVYLDSFWIDCTEVTNAMFKRFIKDTGYITETEQDGKGWVYDSSS